MLLLFGKCQFLLHSLSQTSYINEVYFCSIKCCLFLVNVCFSCILSQRSYINEVSHDFFFIVTLWGVGSLSTVTRHCRLMVCFRYVNRMSSYSLFIIFLLSPDPLVLCRRLYYLCWIVLPAYCLKLKLSAGPVYMLTMKCLTLLLNSLAPGKFEWNVIFEQTLVIDGWGICCEIVLIWMSLNFADD